MRILILVEGGIVQNVIASHQPVDDREQDCEREEIEVFMRNFDESDCRKDCKVSQLPVELIQNFQFDYEIEEEK